MTEFSSEWLDLREAADKRSRCSETANAVAARFALRDEIRVVDIGSGTGANLRATAALLPRHQTWTLVDNDATLLEQARAKLRRWADSAEGEGETLQLEKDGRTIAVRFANADVFK